MHLYGLAKIRGADRVSVRDQICGAHPQLLPASEKTGFVQVHRCSDEESLGALLEQALKSLSESLVAELDVVIAVSSIAGDAPGAVFRHWKSDALKPTIQVLHIQEACTGFLSGLELAFGLLETRPIQAVAIVTFDAYSKYLSEDSTAQLIFSDGVCVTLLTSERLENLDEQCWGDFSLTMTRHFTSFGKSDVLGIHGGNFAMNGPAVFQFAVQSAMYFADELEALDPALKPREWFIHQGSRAIVERVAQILETEPQQLFRASHEGNFVGSSIPMQLFQASHDGLTSLGLISFGMGPQASLLTLAPTESPSPSRTR